MVGLKQPTMDWKHISGASFWGCLGVFVVNLDAVGHKFAASFWPKTAEKTKFLWKLRFSQTFYFYHSFWKTLYVYTCMCAGLMCAKFKAEGSWFAAGQTNCCQSFLLRHQKTLLLLSIAQIKMNFSWHISFISFLFHFFVKLFGLKICIHANHIIWYLTVVVVRIWIELL